MGYSRTSEGPGGIAALQSGIGLTYGPTIGSNDRRAEIHGLGGLGKLAISPTLRASVLNIGARILQPTSRIVNTTKPAIQVLLPESDTMAVPGDESPYVEEPGVEPTVEPPATIPSWVWVVGGLGVFAAIGGIAWYALK